MRGLHKELKEKTRLNIINSDQNQLKHNQSQNNHQEYKRQMEEIAKGEPLVQKTLEIFGGKIIDVVKKPTTGGMK